MKEIIEISRSKCATDYNKEDQKRKAKTTKKNSINIKPWIYCFLKRNTACILALFTFYSILLDSASLKYSISLDKEDLRVIFGIDLSLLHFELRKHSCNMR